MLREYLRTAARVLRRHRLQGALSTFGLAVGLATVMLVGLYAQDEWSYDRFHERGERIYRLIGDYKSDAGTASYARVPPAMAPAILGGVSDVQAAVRLQHWTGAVRVDDRVYQADGFYYADSSFFGMFSYPFVRGSARDALRRPFTVVLTESAARRYFGDADPVGRVIEADGMVLEVTGVVADAPGPSHLSFNGLISFTTFVRQRPEIDVDHLWSWGTFYSYVMLREGANPMGTGDRVRQVVEARQGPSGTSLISTRLQPIRSIHLRSELRQEIGPNGSAGALGIFIAIAVCVLVIAGVNFVNLATARGLVRAREVGVRKSMGASRGQLAAQFLVESALIGLVAYGLALVLAAVALPYFDGISGKSFDLGSLFQPLFGVGGLVLAAFTGLASGVYPALHLAGLTPERTLRPGRVSSRGRGSRLRSGLVVAQFAASIFLIAGTFVALDQVKHMRTEATGFDGEQVVVLPFQWAESVHERYGALRDELLAIPSVRAVTASGDVPGRMFTSMGVWAEGMAEDASAGVNALIVDPDFAETYGLEVAAGRDFSRDHPSDWDDAFMLNESAARLLGWTPEEAVGKRFAMNGPGTIVGVFKDFHYTGVQNAIEPLALAMWPSWFGYVSVRVKGGSVAELPSRLQAAWSRVLPDRPFEMFFLNEDFDRQYRAEIRFADLGLTLSALAILIACLGLYGLAAFMVERRTKEIGIRKSLGAGSVGIATLLSRDFARLVAVAFVLSGPLAWLVMERWLQGFASRIDVSPLVLLAAGLVSFGIAMLTVSAHTLRAAHADPVRALRYE